MTDEGRLQLSDDGTVVDSSGASSPVLDLADPTATQQLSATALESWLSSSVASWLRARRRPLAAVTAVALAVGVAAAWWTNRPAPPPPPPPLALTDAPNVGDGRIGVSRTADGLSVAYTARAREDLRAVDVLGLRGPGLAPSGVERGADTISPDGASFVQLGAQLDCTNTLIASAVPSSYGLALREETDGGPGPVTFQAFGADTARLDVAVRDACLAGELPAHMSVESGQVSGPPSSSIVDVRITVRNDNAVPLTVTTTRTPTTSVETDLSPTVLVPPHESAEVPTRVLVHDCRGPSRPPALADLPNPVVGSASAGADPAGITVRLGLGEETTTASYALPWTVEELSKLLATTACDDPPSVSAKLVGIAGTRSIDGSWLVTGSYVLRTSGIGISLGRQHLTGPAAPDSSMASTDSLVPGVRWVLAPVRLDGGAGQLPVTFSGTSCADRDKDIPTSMGIEVTAPSRAVYPFELPLDTAALRAAVDRACSGTSTVSVPGWGEVTPGATPAA